MLEEDEAEDRDGFFVVWPENEATLDLFLVCSGQWRVVVRFTGGVVYRGLDYAGLKAAMDMLGITEQREVFRQIRAMERAALAELNGAGGK